MSDKRKREIWIDDVKIIACTLVVIGHFLQSMELSGIITQSKLYLWFIQSIYYFHVPLFFICSGYLYQKFGVVDNWESWKNNTIKKALNLGIPFFVFTFITWALKYLFSGVVNRQPKGLFEILFTNPTAPYWYLYALFFIFVVTPTFKNKKMANIVLIIACALKVVSLIKYGLGIYVFTIVCANEIWFVFGMIMAVYRLTDIKKDKKILYAGILLFIFFIVASIMVYEKDIAYSTVKFVLGMIACIAVIIIVIQLTHGNNQNRICDFWAKYTLPVFLMHTIFAAMLRSALFKFGIKSASIHFVLGIAISFAGPVITAKLMKITKYPEFVLYPAKFIKTERHKIK